MSILSSQLMYLKGKLLEEISDQFQMCKIEEAKLLLRSLPCQEMSCLLWNKTFIILLAGAYTWVLYWEMNQSKATAIQTRTSTAYRFHC